ncbi:hypothetical protein RCL1_002778 [Eukaryota sp. TZLM3-RCL]
MDSLLPPPDICFADLDPPQSAAFKNCDLLHFIVLRQNKLLFNYLRRLINRNTLFTFEKLLELDRLHLVSNQITDLDGLEGLLNLETLHINLPMVSDLTPVIFLPKLTTLVIESECDSLDLSVLKESRSIVKIVLPQSSTSTNETPNNKDVSQDDVIEWKPSPSVPEFSEEDIPTMFVKTEQSWRAYSFVSVFDITLRGSHWKNSFIEISHAPVASFQLTLLFGTHKTHNNKFNCKLGLYDKNSRAFVGLELSDEATFLKLRDQPRKLVAPAFNPKSRLDHVVVHFNNQFVSLKLSVNNWSTTLTLEEDYVFGLMGQYDQERYRISI